MIYFLFIVAAIGFLVLIIDAIPIFNTWQGRIKMGRFADNEIWNRKVLDVAKRWLNNTPSIKLTDNNRFIIIDILCGNYKRNSIQSWQEAALLLGLNNYAATFGNKLIHHKIDAFLTSKLDSNGNWKIPPTEIDTVILGYAILKINDIDYQKHQPAFQTLYKMILDLKGTDGTIAYRKHDPEYRYVDTLGFISPFLVRYGLLFNNTEAIQLGLNQIREFTKYGMLDTTFIPCHSYNIESKLPVGLFGWGRGLGWFSIGLIDSWLELPSEHQDKNELTQMIIKLSKTILHFQNENGSWNWIVMSKEKQSDSSATAILSWFLSNAATIPEIAIECNLAKERALHYLKGVTRRNGAIDFSQGDTKGIGVYSQHFDILPFTQGFCLRTLYAESN